MVCDHLELLIFVLVAQLEWVDAAEHLVNHQPQRPVVCHAVVSRALDDLRRQVLWGSAECVGHFVTLLLDLRQPKICELQVPVRVKNHILWLQISVYNTVLVQVLKSQQHLGGVEYRSSL